MAPAAVSKSQKGCTRSHASCSCIICPQAETAISKRMLPLLPEHSLRYQRFKRAAPGRSLFATGYCCPCRGSWPPSDLLPNRCMLQRMLGCVLMSFHRPLPYPSLLQCDPYANLCAAGCTYGFGANGHPGLQHQQQRLARGHPQWCTALGGLQDTKEAKVLSRPGWPTRWHLDTAPWMAIWLQSQLLTHSVFRNLAIPEMYDSSARQIAQ